jgi:hypothetical protein
MSKRSGLGLGLADRLPLWWRLRRLRLRYRAFCDFLDTWLDQ